MATFDELVRKTKQLSTRISESTGVPPNTVMNVLHYAKNLTLPSNPEALGELLFVAQMGLRFGITSRYHVQLIFEALREPRTTVINLEEYVKVVCIFLSPDLDVRIDFVFKVYNFNHSGYITHSDITQMLRSSIVQNFGDEDPTEQLKELVEMVLNVVDTNGDGMVSLDEFREFVKRDILCLELFGKVLPSERVLKSFRDMVTTMTPMKIKEYFSGERKSCLGEPKEDKSKMAGLFQGVVLDLP